MEFHHIPVLLAQCMEALSIQPDGIYLDGTVGGAGHSKEIAARLQTGRLICLDQDPDAVATARERLAGLPATVIQENFRNTAAVLDGAGVTGLNGALLDLGVSSHQLDTAARGFSYRADAPLDMRMDQTAPLDARDVVNGSSFEQLCRILRDYGEERYASRIASRIVQARARAPIETTGQLAELVCAAMPGGRSREAQHPARRTFQAIRIAVNGELDGLRAAIDGAHELLAPGGRLVVLTFHSLEDRIVKQAFRAYEHPCTCPPKAPVCTCGRRPTARVLTKKPLACSAEEAAQNSRAACAKLRAIEKLPASAGAPAC